MEFVISTKQFGKRLTQLLNNAIAQDETFHFYCWKTGPKRLVMVVVVDALASYDQATGSEGGVPIKRMILHARLPQDLTGTVGRHVETDHAVVPHVLRRNRHQRSRPCQRGPDS